MTPRLPQSNLFIGGDIRIITVALAALVGLNEAIVLQQVWFWLERSRHVHDGRVWVYNTYEGWQRQFPWWSVPTVKRTFLKLEGDGLLLIGRFNPVKVDRTKWYTVDFDHLDRLRAARDETERPTDHIDPMHDGSDRSHEGIRSILSVPETTPEITKGTVSLEDRLAVGADPDGYLERRRNPRRPRPL